MHSNIRRPPRGHARELDRPVWNTAGRRAAVGHIDFATFFRDIGTKGWHLPNWEQDNAPGGSANPGQSLLYAEQSYNAMARLRG